MMKRWKDWAYIFERDNHIEIGHRDFGDENEVMNQKDFLESLRIREYEVNEDMEIED